MKRSTEMASFDAPVRILETGAEERELLRDAILGVTSAGPLRILEAGCGQRWPVDLGDRPLHITGVDTDAEAMRLRHDQHGDLHEALVADLRSVQLKADSFDVVYCSFVLEHVAGAREVLERFRMAVRPGGRIIVRVPDGDSVYGLLVQHSPHRLHVFYKRYAEGNRQAGTPGHAPYPVIYDPVVSLRGLREWATAEGLNICTEYATFFLPRRLRRAQPVIAALFRVISLLAPGRRATGHRDLGMVFERPGEVTTT